MTIPRVHFTPLPSSAAAYSTPPGGHTTPSAVAVPEGTFGVPGLELLMTERAGLATFIRRRCTDMPCCRTSTFSTG